MYISKTFSETASSEAEILPGTAVLSFRIRRSINSVRGLRLQRTLSVSLGHVVQ